ncbi:hypothetical protein BC828DRAFT_412737, partial [Blastocladiella britannica]
MPSPMLVALMTAALACLAAASPVSILPSNSNNGTTIKAEHPPKCKILHVADPIRVYERDVPGQFDVRDGFWAANDQACAQAALDAGYRGA